MRILILCTGNSCRSQMAHGYLASFNEKITVCSAGTEPAERVNELAIKVMAEDGIDISTHTPKSVDNYLDQDWEFVITVCGGANESCPTFNGKVMQRLHFGFDDPSKVEGSEEFIMGEFHRVRDEIKKRFHRFDLQDLRWEFMPSCTCGCCG